MPAGADILSRLVMGRACFVFGVFGLCSGSIVGTTKEFLDDNILTESYVHVMERLSDFLGFRELLVRSQLALVYAPVMY